MIEGSGSITLTSGSGSESATLALRLPLLRRLVVRHRRLGVRLRQHARRVPPVRRLQRHLHVHGEQREQRAAARRGAHRRGLRQRSRAQDLVLLRLSHGLRVSHGTN
jgi:hypothetical protein